MPGNNGKCPVCDEAPSLLVTNQLPVAIYHQALPSATQVADDGKTHFFIRPSDIEALMRVHDVPVGDRVECFERVLILQAEGNRLRPRRRAKPGRSFKR